MAKYIVLKNKDSYGGDYTFYPNKTIEELKSICDNTLDCVGFNSLGYLKKNVCEQEGMSDNDGCDLYIREDRIKHIIEKKKISSLDITFVITSCKRLDLFCETMDKFFYHCEDVHLIKKWICVDDNSSEKDRKQMRKKYPFMHFIMKTPEQRGHAKSLNMVLDNVKTKYVIFFEDDWRCNLNFSISSYVDFLEKYGKDQVVFHGRSASDGYPKVAMLTNKDIYEYCYNPNHYGKKETMLKVYYEKFEKEFNIKGSNVGFFYPGFSLNPSIFCMDKIRENKFRFREEEEFNDCMEVYFAFQCLSVGFKVTFTNILVCHIGKEVSAYVLNETPRCFDKKI